MASRAAWIAPSVFLSGMICGSIGTITSKVLFSMKGVDSFGETSNFEKPVFQTLLMFIAMCLALPLHFIWSHYQRSTLKGHSLNAEEKANQVTGRMLLVLALPSLSDAVATLLAYIGLRYIPSSIYQMMKSTIIIFVALFKVTMLGHKLHSHMWLGVFLNTCAIGMVGVAGVLASDDDAGSDPVMGVVFVVCSCLVQATQYVMEEKFMSAEEGEEPCPPLVVVGMEGVWGAFFTLFGLYPLAYLCPGADHGSYERLDSGMSMMSSSSSIQRVVLLYCVCIFVLNVMAIFITFLLSSVWKAIMDNFRPVCVWVLDLILFYVVSNGSMGESWNVWSYLQLAALFTLLLGTGVYNGSIEVPIFIDYTSSYSAVSPDGAIVDSLTPKSMQSSTLMRSPMVEAGAARQEARAKAASLDRGKEYITL